jgi:DNA-binding NarL/FixJ family response regulator
MENVKQITLFLADDHPVVRVGLRTLLEREPDFSIIGESASGLQTVDLVKSLKPHILILDLMMPDMHGTEVTFLVKQYSPSTHVIILSMHSSEIYVLEALKRGASGYVLKDSTGSNLIQAIREVISGRRYLSPPLSERSIETYAEVTKNAALEPYEILTVREREVLFMAAQGYRNIEIAGRLSISPRTVEVHRSNLMHKLHLKKQAELVRFAIQKGILPLQE